MGRQPFGLASPAAWLRAQGHQVHCVDLAVSPLPLDVAGQAGLVAIHLPMHTATRLAAPVIERVKRLNHEAHLCCYGLYAPLNEAYLRRLGAGTILGGEFEPGLRDLAARLERGENGAQREELVSLDRLRFLTPDRSDLVGLERYGALRDNGRRKQAGYTEASRGCKHMCRHCPVVPVYQGRFRLVQSDVVLEDIRQQVASGAEHITFGDPDFFNGPGHARRLVEALHQEHPGLTYDVTIKVEHLLARRDLLPVLAATGCVLVTSAVESLDNRVLEKLEKGHTREDFFRVVELFDACGLALAPTFIPFTPWTTWDGYRELLRVVAQLRLVNNVAPVQLALRLLIPSGSRLLELAQIRERLRGYDEAALIHRWEHEEESLDLLGARLLKLVARMQSDERTRPEIFNAIWREAYQDAAAEPPREYDLMPRVTVPYLEEPWYC